MEILEQAEQLKAEIDAMRPLEVDIDARIWQKFRLDWNYHSNKLEGNTYSFGETKMLLLKGLTAGGKPVRDHEEISGHDEAISFLLDSIKEGEELTEVFIRHLHKMILVRPTWADAKTSDGKPTKRLIKVGEYKTEPNHVETQTGEIFYFAEPIETPAKMQELVEWFRSKIASPDTNTILLAAEFHYRFVLIHPFDDGNGRLARLLMNFILMRDGYPPVIIKNEDKDNYIAVLEQANFNILDPFVEYVATNLVRSLEVMINGEKGKDIEEPEDLDKELLILEKKVRNTGRKIEIPRSKEVILKVFDESIAPLISRFIETCKKFDRFYVESNFTLYLDGGGVNKSKDDAIEAARDRIESNNWGIGAVGLRYDYNAFNQEGLDEARYDSTISVKFEMTKYRVFSSDDNRPQNMKDLIIFEKLYSENLTENEINSIMRLKAKEHKAYIEQKYEDWELRT